jgi:APA family basic amino acid/polyamine antiporter
MSLVMLYPFNLLADKPANLKIAGFAYAFTQRGMTWAKYIVALGACIGIFTSTGIGIYGLSRIFQVFAREGMIPAGVGHVNSYTVTPILAVAIAGTVSGAMAFFTAFDTLANMTSIGTLTMYWFVAISFIYRRYSPEFEVHHGDRHLAIPFRPSFLSGLSVTLRRAWVLFLITMITLGPVGFAIYWNLSTGSWALGMCAGWWFFWACVLQLTCSIHYVPEKFSLPWWCLPWVPCISIWANIMLVGGFGATVDDYYRLFGAMAIGTVVYCLFGIHASYWRFYRSGEAEEDGEFTKPGMAPEGEETTGLAGHYQ